MTLPNELNRIDAVSAGGATYPYTFKIFSASDLTVIVTGTDGVSTPKALTADYSVTGAGTDAGGTVVFVVAPTAGHTVSIIASVPLTQTTDLVNETGFYQDRIETALDRTVRMAQVTKEIADRGMRLPAGEAGSDLLTVLPSLADRKGRQLTFDPATGQPTASSPTSAAVSAAMEDTIASATLALARAAMGPWGDAMETADGGTAARSRSSKSGEALSVKDFGAIGNGVTDDTSAIQAAINHASATGASVTIHVPAGSYKVTSTITLLEGCHLVGDGQKSTRIVPSATFTGSYVFVMGDLGTDYVFDCTIEKLNIWGYSAPAGLHGVYSQQTQEQCGVFRCNIESLGGCGIWLHKAALPSIGPAKFIIDDVQIYGKSGHSHSVWLDGAYAIVNQGSFVGLAASTGSYGVFVDGTNGSARLDAYTIHCERHDAAIAVNDAGRLYANGVTLTNGGGTVKGAIYIAFVSTPRPVHVSHIYSQHPAIYDSYSSYTSGIVIDEYVIGDYSTAPAKRILNGINIGGYAPGVPALTARHVLGGSGDLVQFQRKSDGVVGWAVTSTGIPESRITSGWNGSAWDGVHMLMGAYHFWVDASGRLRVKSSAPSSDTDGTIVGTQT